MSELKLSLVPSIRSRKEPPFHYKNPQWIYTAMSESFLLGKWLSKDDIIFKRLNNAKSIATLEILTGSKHIQFILEIEKYRTESALRKGVVPWKRKRQEKVYLSS